LNADAFRRVWSDGQAMSVEQAVGEAVSGFGL